MTECNRQLVFPFFKSAQLTATFQGGEIVSDAGLLLVRQFDERIRFTKRLAKLLPDPRDPFHRTHSPLELFRQRLYQIIGGYEDCNDAGRLRNDSVFKAVADRAPEDAPLASQPTLSRFENGFSAHTCREMAEDFVRTFIETRPAPPKEIVLEMDPSEIPTYGDQQLTFFNGYYDNWMYFPNFLVDADSGFILAPVLRPGNAGAAEGAMLVLHRVVQLLRAAWPGVVIRFRADAGFCDPDLLTWLDEERIPYVIGMGENDALKAISSIFVLSVEDDFARTGLPQRAFGDFPYQTLKTWPHPRRVIVKVEVSDLGTNIRYVVTNDRGRSAGLYDWFTQRGGAIERVFHQLKSGLSADRMSCQSFNANYFRLILFSAAYNLLVLFRERLAHPRLRHADISSLRIRLIKVGARIQRSVRRIWIHLSASWPFRDLFLSAYRDLVLQPGG